MATSAGYTATATGTDYWVATYNGDSNNASVTSGATARAGDHHPGAPAIDTSQRRPVAGVRHARSPTRPRSAAAYSPTGTVTFNLYSNSRQRHATVTDAAAPSQRRATSWATRHATGTGTYYRGHGTTAGYTATVTGTYQWVAVYSGDAQQRRRRRSAGSSTAAFIADLPTHGVHRGRLQPVQATRRQLLDRRRLSSAGDLDGYLPATGAPIPATAPPPTRRHDQRLGHQRHRPRAGDHRRGEPREVNRILNQKRRPDRPQSATSIADRRRSAAGTTRPGR